MSDIEKYSDIIHLPHFRSKTHPHMPTSERAAQFSPFAALKGYEDEIEETARWTDEKTELDESALSVLNETLRILKEREREHPRVTVCFFQPDSKKAGGAYRSARGRVKKTDEYERKLVLEEGEIPFENLVEIELE